MRPDGFAHNNTLLKMQHRALVDRALRQRADTLSVYGVVSRYPTKSRWTRGMARLARQYADDILRRAQGLAEETSRD